MIQHFFDFEKYNNNIASAFKQINISKILRTSGINKMQGISVFDIFSYIFLLAFTGKNLYRTINSHNNADSNTVSKNTYYRFLNSPKNNWRAFIHNLTYKLTTDFNKTTSQKRVKVFILDDTTLNKNSSKKAELLAKVYDHVKQKYIKGYKLLTLGWSDGYSTLVTDFALMSSPNKKNRYNEIKQNINKNSLSYKRREEAKKSKPQVAVEMIKRAMQKGIVAEYTLMDSWFTSPKLIKQLLEIDMHTIGMLKKGKTKYKLEDKNYTLSQLYKNSNKIRRHKILSSIIVKTKEEIDIKLVFVRNKENKKQYLTLLSTDITINEEEIQRIYANRWNIEVLFKASKNILKLENEFQSVNYDMLIAHITIVFTRYIILEYLKRTNNDMRYSVDKWFYKIFDEIRDMGVQRAINIIMELFEALIKEIEKDKQEYIKSQVHNWIMHLPQDIKHFINILEWES